MSKVCVISIVHNALDNRIFYREACSLQKAGYTIVLIGIHDYEEIRQGIRIIPVKRLKRIQRPILWLKVLKMALSTKPDIFHIHDPELLVISPLLRLLAHQPVIYDIHESAADFFEIKDDLPGVVRKFFAWLFRWLEPALARFQSGLIFADDQIAASFSGVKLPKTTLFNFPSETFLEAAAKAKIIHDPEQPAVLYLGGLKRNRGTRLIVEAFHLILEKIPRAQLFLVGPFAPTSLETEMRTEIFERNMNNSVTITGAVPFIQIGDYLARASIGWIPFPPVPKYQKNIPTKLFEYMAYGLPVVCSDLHAIQPFIENGKNGVLVAADDPVAHANAVISLISDPTLADTIGKAGKDTVLKHYRWSEEEKKLFYLYEQLLSD